MKSSGACHVLGSHATRLAVLCLVTFAVLPSLNRPQNPAEAPLFEIQEGSSVKFDVKASVPIAGTFDKWNAAASSRSTTAASIRSSTAQPISKRRQKLAHRLRLQKMRLAVEIDVREDGSRNLTAEEIVIGDCGRTPAKARKA